MASGALWFLWNSERFSPFVDRIFGRTFPALEAWVDLQELSETSSDQLVGFNDRLMAWMPTLVEHRCSIGQRGGFFERLRRGTYLAHILEHVALELQTVAGTPVSFGRARRDF